MRKKDEDATTGIDVPLKKLIPIRKRRVGERGYNKLRANIQTVGIIDPLLTCRDGGSYYILDGYVRFCILEELGMETAPCIVIGKRDFYTPNRQVNHLSRFEEGRMLQKALESLSEEEIAAAFGLKSLTRKKPVLPKDTHPDVLAAIATKKLTMTCAKELGFVTPDRQAHIIESMAISGDYSLAFARSQIVNTPKMKQVIRKGRISPWERSMKKQNDLVERFQEANRHSSFYQDLYKTYVQDLIKLVIYVRELINNPQMRTWLEQNYPKNLSLLDDIIAEDLPMRKGKTVLDESA